jgi:hypothetical protein
MPWDCEQTIQGSNRILLPCTFNSRVLAVDITSTNQKATWYNSGFLRAILDLDGQAFIGADIKTSFGQQVIELPFSSYQIDFAPRVWLDSTTIRIKQLSSTQISNIMPNYGPMPTAIGEQPVLDSLPTSFSAPQYLAASLLTAYQCLPANPARQTFAVTNTGTAPVFLDLDAPTSATKRFVTVAVNGTYVSDFPYVGAVFIWSTTATAQACEIREFIQ